MERKEQPNDSWFAEEELNAQRALNIHARFWQNGLVSDPHLKQLTWWEETGAAQYRQWQNDTHRCERCDNLSFIAEQLNRNPEKEGE